MQPVIIILLGGDRIIISWIEAFANGKGRLFAERLRMNNCSLHFMDYML